MPYIEGRNDLQWYREKFSDIWQSATLTFSSVEVDGVQVPNGELVFSDEADEEGTEVLYREGALSVYEINSNSPFDLLNQMVNGEIPVDGGTAEIENEVREHNTHRYFHPSTRQSRVREDRPQMEVNAAVDIAVPKDLGEEYRGVLNKLDDQLMRVEEPYFELGHCEGYYFDCIFRSDRESPAILLFADSGMDLSISESGKLELVSPTRLFEDLFVSILPRRPRNEHKGWRIKFDEEQLESLDNGRSRYTEDLELEGIDKLYADLYLEERSFNTIEYATGGVPENPRYEVMQAFDQDDQLKGHLKGHSPNIFELAVGNALSTAGWLVQWYGEEDFRIPSFSREVSGAQYSEIDVIAYHPENTQILFIECTNQDISKKDSILDRTEAISSELNDDLIPIDISLTESVETVPCVATPQKLEDLNANVVSGFEENGIKLLHRERLRAIYEASRNTTDTVDADIPI